MKFMIPFLIAALIAALPVASVAQAQSGNPGASGVALPKTTEVMVILTAKQGVTRQQITAIMPSEIRETVKLYLGGKIRQWYSRGDGKGVIFLIDAKTQDEARAVMDTLPLSKEQLVDQHSGRTLDAVNGIDGRRSAAVTLLAIALLQEG